MPFQSIFLQLRAKFFFKYEWHLMPLYYFAYYNLHLTPDTSNFKVLNVWILPLGNVCIDNCNGYFLFFECCFYFSLHGTPVSWRWSFNLYASTNLYILPWFPLSVAKYIFLNDTGILKWPLLFHYTFTWLFMSIW